MMRRGMVHKGSFGSRIFFQLLAVTALVALAHPALAATDDKLGTVLNNTTSSFEKLPNIFSMIAYLSGLILGVQAIFKIKDHVDGRPGGPTLADGVKRFIAGGAFFAMPMVSEALYNSFFGNGNKISITSRTGGNATGDGLDALVVRLMQDIGGPTEKLLTAFCYLSAIGFMMVGISRLTKRMEDGPRGPAGMGTIMTFVAAGALFAFGDMMGAFTASIFGDSTIATHAIIANNIGMTADDMTKVQTVIEAVMGFIMIVGFIAFIRGWFVLKNFADGNQGATLAQGLTFLFGGALAINLGELINAFQSTLGITGITFS